MVTFKCTIQDLTGLLYRRVRCSKGRQNIHSVTFPLNVVLLAFLSIKHLLRRFFFYLNGKNLLLWRQFSMKRKVLFSGKIRKIRCMSIYRLRKNLPLNCLKIQRFNRMGMPVYCMGDEFALTSAPGPKVSMKISLLIMKYVKLAFSYLLAENFWCSAMFSKKEFAINSNLKFISRTNFTLSWGEHEKDFITKGPDQNYMYLKTRHYKCVIKNLVKCVCVCVWLGGGGGGGGAGAPLL